MKQLTASPPPDKLDAETGVTAPRSKSDLNTEIERYRKSLEENPGSRLFAALADAMRRSGDINGAISVAEDGLKRHPRYLGGMVVLGQAFADNRQYDRAKELFLQVVRMNPENIVAQRALAGIYEEIGDTFNAMRTYAILNILDPSDKKVRTRLQELEEARTAMGRGPDSGVKPFSNPPVKAKSSAADANQTPQPEGTAVPDKTGAGPTPDDKPSPLAESERPGVEPPPAPEEPPPPVKTEVEKRMAGLDQFFDSDKTQELELKPVPTTPAAEASSAPPAKDGNEPGEASDTQVISTEPEIEPPPVLTAQLNIEEKLELFFGGVDPDRVSIGSRAAQFVVKAAAEAIDEDTDSPPPSSPEDDAGLVITASKLGAIFWSQGFREKAVEVMAGEVHLWPDDENLRREFEQAARTLGLDPEAKLASVPPPPPTDIVRASEKTMDDVAPQPAAGLENGGAKAEEEQSADPRVRILRSYLSRIRKDKESKS